MLPSDSINGVTAEAHQELEQAIHQDPNGLPEWLWSHGKWKIHSRVESRYRMLVKRKHIIKDKKIERVTNFFVRLPNWLGDVVMAIPVLIAIRKGRPDVRFTLVCKCEYIGLLRKFDLGEDFIALPERSFLYFLNFRKKIAFKPENYLLFTNSFRSDIEAFLSGSPQRFGIKLPGRVRPLLTHAFDSANIGANDSQVHQTSVWEEMARNFGLREKIDSTPLLIPSIKRRLNKIGIIPGSSNSPEKRWGVQNWISLVKKLKDLKLGHTFHLYGTNQDKDITTAISCAVNSKNIFDHAGTTSLSELAEELATCSLVIGNDTGSMHLANMVGAPVVVLFGPTNSSKTKPFFDTSCTIIHSSTDDINDIVVDDVLRHVYPWPKEQKIEHED